MIKPFYKLMFLSLLITPAYIGASEVPARYTQENFQTSYHDKPVSFDMDEYGNFSGITETGKLFTQTYVTNSISVRMQKFTIEDAYFYVSSIGVIYANSDLQALSVYLSHHDSDLSDFEQV